MKVGIFVYTQSGHTAEFARTIAQLLREKGIYYHIELLRPKGVLRPHSRDIKFRQLPKLDDYDTLVFGAPVRAFNVCAVIPALAKSLPSLEGKRALPIVTHSLPLKAFGANRALANMRKAFELLGAEVLEGESQFYYIFTTNKKTMLAAAQRVVNRIEGKVSAQ